jgi:hypothetical protein
LTASALQREPVSLPIELRAAIDLAVLASGGYDGVIRGRAVGQTQLVAEMSRYAPFIDAASTRILALGVAQDVLRDEIIRSTPEEVLTIVTGPLSGLVSPLRTNCGRKGEALTADLTRPLWRSLGYELRETIGVQGIGSLFWIGGDRFFRRAGRPDLADRCRIAMLRTLVAAQSLSLATIHLRRYRRVLR